MPGPRKTPTAELEKRGSWRAKEPSRQNEISVPLVLDIPAPPDWLESAAADIWQIVAGEIHAAGLLTNADMTICGFLCERIAQYIKLRDHKSCKQPTIVVGNKIHQNPTIKLRDEAQRDCIRIIKDLGMSPTARIGLVLSGTPKKGKPAGEISLFAKG